MKEHKGMNDNRMVKENHQQGIERVKQRPGDMEKGQPGKMHNKGSAEWNRSRTKATTPRGA